MVLVAVVAGHAFLELEVRQMSDQLREDGSASVHPSLFRRSPPNGLVRSLPFLVQIVFSPKVFYADCGKGLIGFRKVLYRTLVGQDVEITVRPSRKVHGELSVVIE